MGDGNQAVYDKGFYNIGVTRTQANEHDDLDADNLLDLSRKVFYTGKFGVMKKYSIACNNATFGDPKPGHPKECNIYSK